MIKRKAKTALVFNPSGRQLSINGSRSRSKVKRRGKRRNPVAVKAVARRRNPNRKSNPINSVTALVATAAMAGIGVSLFDVAATYLIPSSSSLVRVGVKAGGAWALNEYGKRIPVLGAYHKEIALVVLTSAAIDLFKLYLFPVVAKAASSFGLAAAPAPVLSAAPDDGGVAGFYGEQFTPAYYG